MEEACNTNREAIDDIDILRQMYATLCGGMDDALTLLEAGNVWEVKQVLLRALEVSEELYVAGISSVDELAPGGNLLDTQCLSC